VIGLVIEARFVEIGGFVFEGASRLPEHAGPTLLGQWHQGLCPRFRRTGLDFVAFGFPSHDGADGGREPVFGGVAASTARRAILTPQFGRLNVLQNRAAIRVRTDPLANLPDLRNNTVSDPPRRRRSGPAGIRLRSIWLTLRHNRTFFVTGSRYPTSKQTCRKRRGNHSIETNSMPHATDLHAVVFREM
jgi:hypothetical protein